MSRSVYARPFVTDSGGDASPSPVRSAGAALVGVNLEIGTMSAVDFTLTDEPSGTVLLAVTGAAADTAYQPMAAGADPTDGTALTGAFAPPTVYGRIEIAVANGGDTLNGALTLVLER